MNAEQYPKPNRPPEPLKPKEKPVSGTSEVAKLPIYAIKNNLTNALSASDIVVVVAGTGAGKTLGLPIMIREALGDKRVVITQPRRSAADEVATKEITFLGESRLGQTVGIRHKGMYKASDDTRIMFEVEGSLLNDLKDDITLANHDVVVVDEVHERGINTDLILALLKNTQNERKKAGMPPLKIVATSATLDARKFLDYFKDENAQREVPLIDLDIASKHNRKMNYEKQDIDPKQMPAAAAKKTVVDIISRGAEMEGDILIFMPGEAEINQTTLALNAYLEAAKLDPAQFDIRKFTRKTTKAEVSELESKTTDKRRIIVATTAAETSVTLPIKHVIDSGLVNRPTIDPETGIEVVVNQEHSQSGVIQREGRVGRKYDGTCWHLFSEENFQKRPPYQSPEIQNVDLTSTVLTLKNLGMDFNDLKLLDKPDARVVENAVRSLKILGALDDKGNITTDIGKEMAEYTVDAHLARMMVEAKKRGCEDYAATVAAFYEHADKLFTQPDHIVRKILSQYQDPHSDFITYLNLWNDIGANHPGDNKWLEHMGLNQKTLLDIGKTRYELTKIPTGFTIDQNKLRDLRRCIAIAFSDNLMSMKTFREQRDGTKIALYKWEKNPTVQNIIIAENSELFGTTPSDMVAGKLVRHDRAPSGKTPFTHLEFCHRIDNDEQLLKELRDNVDRAIRKMESGNEKTIEDEIKEIAKKPIIKSPAGIPDSTPPGTMDGNVIRVSEKKPGILRRFINKIKAIWRKVVKIVKWPFHKLFGLFRRKKKNNIEN